MSVVEKDPRSKAGQLLDEAIGRVDRLKAAGNLGDAYTALRDAASSIFGPIGATLEQVDAQSAARLLGSGDRITIAAVLLSKLADLDEQRGEANRARAGRRRALELYLEVTLLGPDPDPAVLAAIAVLRPQADEWRLAERYQGALQRILQPRT